MPAETSAVLVDGWLRTGDLVRREPDALYTFVARRKEVIRRRGETPGPAQGGAGPARHRGATLAPAEGEAGLAERPDVAEVAVVGVLSALTEEEVKAFVVPRP